MSTTEKNYQILKAIKEKKEASIQEISEALNLDHSAAMRSILSLQQNGLISTSEVEKNVYTLTDEGKKYAEEGLPERRLTEAVVSQGGSVLLSTAVEASGIQPKTANIAVGWLVRKGWGKIVKGEKGLKVEAREIPAESSEEQLLKLFLTKRSVSSDGIGDRELQIIKELKRRNLLSEKPSTKRKVVLTEAGLERLRIEPEIEPKLEITALTSELISSGKWREVRLREYDVTAAPPSVYPGSKHFYLEFLEELKRALISMGFEEAEGPYVELELWNFDVLFQPQDHPAREIHDSYQLENPKFGVLKDKTLVEKVKKSHESGWKTGSKGWNYHWNPEIARRLILRTQTTAVSARFLYNHKVSPLKMFCLSKVFRPDVLDARHSMEFYQCEGIIMDKGLNFRHLLGVLEDIATAVGIGKIVFTPGYFPFTEPSVEAFTYHPKMGWIESAGAGIFRPEVTKPLGVKYPVLAWGIGVDRLAMVKLQVDDIRELHSRRLGFLRER